jgi:hypothetical protein
LTGPDESIYLVSLIQACRNCDGPAGIEIDLFPSKKALLEWCFEMPPELPLDIEVYGHKGVNIATGFLAHEFTEALKSHLIGLVSDDFAENPGDGLDEIAADEVLDEMYADSTFTPRLVVAKCEGQ